MKKKIYVHRVTSEIITIASDKNWEEYKKANFTSFDNYKHPIEVDNEIEVEVLKNKQCPKCGRKKIELYKLPEGEPITKKYLLQHWLTSCGCEHWGDDITYYSPINFWE